ncbi:MAG: hypothetical protein WC375_06745 [Methanomassiliicoccales archaeon]|jgi:hypothetical protein
MMVSLKVYDEGDEYGRIEIYDRRTPSSTVLIGAFKFQEEKEKNALLDMLVSSHPEVDVIPTDVSASCFGDRLPR